jgi:hypothetical protein
MIDFAPFRRRVRLLRGLTGLSVGLVAGGLASALLVGAASWHWLEWPFRVPALAGAAGLLALCAAVGWTVGWTRPSPDVELAKSLDLRTRAKDRIASATMVHEGEFTAAVAKDAAESVSHASAARVYPFRPGGWHYSALACCALPLVAHFTALAPALLDPQGARERAETKRRAPEVERVAREVEEQTKSDQSPQSKALANELRKMAQDMKAERVDRKAEAQKSAEIRRLANDLARTKADQAQQALTRASEAQRKMQEKASEARELTDRQQMVASMTDQEREDAIRRAEAEQEANNRQIQALQKQLQDSRLSPEERAKIEKELAERLKQAQEMAALLKDLKLDPEVLRKFREALNDPANRELRELMAQLQRKLAQQQGKAAQNKLTKEDIERLQAQIKEIEARLKKLTEMLKDRKAVEEMIKQLREALKNAKEMGQCKGGLGFGLGMPGLGPDSDIGLQEEGVVNKTAKPQAEAGKTVVKAVTGQRQEQGEESYMEVRGPAELTPRSSVPTVSIPASATRKAEQSIARGRIPAKHTERVRSYFDSLARGK